MWQPLHCAAQHGHSPVVQLLLSSRASADAANKVSAHNEPCRYCLHSAQDGWTAMHLACRWRHAVCFLHQSFSSFMCFLRHGSLPCIHALLQAGCRWPPQPSLTLEPFHFRYFHSFPPAALIPAHATFALLFTPLPSTPILTSQSLFYNMVLVQPQSMPAAQRRFTTQRAQAAAAARCICFFTLPKWARKRCVAL